MRRFSLLAVVVMVLSLVTVPAFAAGMEKTTNVQGEAGQQLHRETVSQGQKMAPRAEMSTAMLRGDDIIGKDVKNASGEKLGSVKDVAIDRDGRISYVILSKGEVLGMGGDLIPVPWEMVTFAAAGEARRGQAATEPGRVSRDVDLVVNLSKEDLDNAPTLKDEDWSLLSESDYDSKVHSYYEERRSTGVQGKEGLQKEMDTTGSERKTD